jgi:formylglycine-generating enzyme
LSPRINCLKTAIAVVLFAVSAPLAMANVVMQTVPVGNPGNASDTRYTTPGYGGVAYTYSIGKYEVTTDQYCAFLNAVAASDPYGLYSTSMDPAFSTYPCNIERGGSAGSYTYTVGNGSPSDVANWANRPVNYISWGDAARFANWMHNGQPTGAQGPTSTEDGSYYLNGAASDAELMAVTRRANATWVLPSEDEWYKAAYHRNDGVTGNYFWYPTNSSYPPSNRLINPDPGNNANFYSLNSGTYHHTIGSPYWRTPVGEFENSDSPYGTFDQGGNVYEWNEANIDGSRRGVRGGSFWTGDYNVLYADARGGWYPSDGAFGDGFRLALVPEPSTTALLALPLLALTRRPRIRLTAKS